MARTIENRMTHSDYFKACKAVTDKALEGVIEKQVAIDAIKTALPTIDPTNQQLRNIAASTNILIEEPRSSSLEATVKRLEARIAKLEESLGVK